MTLAFAAKLNNDFLALQTFLMIRFVMFSSFSDAVLLMASSSSRWTYLEGEHSVEASLLRIFLSSLIKLILEGLSWWLECTVDVGTRAPWLTSRYLISHLVGNTTFAAVGVKSIANWCCCKYLNACFCCSWKSLRLSVSWISFCWSMLCRKGHSCFLHRPYRTKAAQYLLVP